ncbi:MAG: RDD family protein [Pseudomonadota bacterium]
MKNETIIPPEGVPVRFNVAGVGVRLGAQLIDVILTMLLILAIVIGFAFAGLGGRWLEGFAALTFFFLRVPYYILTELMWNGATLGKRMLGLRVVSSNGRSLGVYGVVARNLMKEAEVFLPMALVFTISGEDPVSGLIAGAWCLMALAIPVFNRRNQRLGDMIAGTYVIHRPEAVLLPDAAEAAQEAVAEGMFTFQTHQLEHYGAFELQTLEGIIRKLKDTKSTHRKAQEMEMLKIVEAIRKKIGYSDPVPHQDHEEFLGAFYAAQRRHLEARQLFGDKRADKFHAEKKDETAS